MIKFGPVSQNVLVRKIIFSSNVKSLYILEYFQNILRFFCLKVEKNQIWLNKMLQYIIM
jgi:hypothetical protein